MNLFWQAEWQERKCQSHLFYFLFLGETGPILSLVTRLPVDKMPQRHSTTFYNTAHRCARQTLPPQVVVENKHGSAIRTKRTAPGFFFFKGKNA